MTERIQATMSKWWWIKGRQKSQILGFMSKPAPICELLAPLILPTLWFRQHDEIQQTLIPNTSCSGFILSVQNYISVLLFYISQHFWIALELDLPRPWAVFVAHRFVVQLVDVEKVSFCGIYSSMWKAYCREKWSLFPIFYTTVSKNDNSIFLVFSFWRENGSKYRLFKETLCTNKMILAWHNLFVLSARKTFFMHNISPFDSHWLAAGPIKMEEYSWYEPGLHLLGHFLSHSVPKNKRCSRCSAKKVCWKIAQQMQLGSVLQSPPDTFIGSLNHEERIWLVPWTIC